MWSNLIKRHTLTISSALIFAVAISVNYSLSFSISISDDYYGLGMKYFKNGDYNKAISYFEKAIRIDPNNSKYYTAIGNVYYEIKNYKDAINWWEKARNINPTDREANENLRKIYSRIEPEEKVNRSIAVSEKNIKPAKPTEEALTFAQRELEQALAFAPRNADIHFNLALVYIEKNALEKAIFHLEKAKEIDPQDVNKYLYLGIAYLKVRKFADAIENLKKVIEVNPNDYLALSYLGLAYLREGKDDISFEYFKKALVLNPGFLIPHIGCAIIYTKRKMFLEAKYEWREVKHLYPDDSDTYNNLGFVLSNIGLVDLAIGEFLLSLEKNRNNILPYYNLGIAYISKDEIKNAIDIWEKLLIIDGRNIEVNYNLGLLYENSGNIERAIEQYKKTLSLDPNHIPAQSNFANAIARKTLPYRINFKKHKINLEYKCDLSYENLPITFPQ